MITDPAASTFDKRGFATSHTILFALLAAALFVGGSLLLQFLYLVVAYNGNAASQSELMAWFMALMVGNAIPFYAQGIGSLPVIAFLLYGLPRIGRRSLRDFGFRTPTVQEVGIGVAAGLVAQLAAALVGFIQLQFTHREAAQDVAKLLGQLHGFDILAAAFFAVIMGPFVEELLFRAFIYRALRRYLNIPLAIIVSGLIFGAAHGQLLFILPLAVTGFVLAAAYERTRCFWVNYLGHMTNNLVAMVAFFVFHIR